MRAIAKTLAEWTRQELPFALATVVSVEGSHPRAPGACLVVSADGTRFAGSVSSGCLEAELIDAAPGVVRDRVVREFEFGPEGGPAWRDGLSCGGVIRVRLEPWWGLSPEPAIRAVGDLVLDWLSAGGGGVVLSRGDRHYAVGEDGRAAGDPSGFSAGEIEAASERLAREASSVVAPGERGACFVRMLPPPPRLVIVGAVDIADALVSMSHRCGYRTLVIDPRRHYADGRRFAEAPGALVNAWPQEAIPQLGLGPRDAAVVLTHDPKIDDAALGTLLSTDVGYLGALGSARSHRERLERLRGLGLASDSLARIEGPAGVRLGRADAASIALGILAGLVRRAGKAELE